MSFKETLTNSFKSALGSLQDQEWFQELKGFWQRLDPEKQFYTQIGLTFCCLCFVLFLFIQSSLNLASTKKQFQEKMELIQFIENGQEELQHIQASMPAQAKNQRREEGEPWNRYLENLGAQYGISPSQLKIASSRDKKEALFKLELSKINLRQITRYAFSLDSGAKPAKLKALKIQALPDGSGYLNAQISLSTLNSSLE